MAELRTILTDVVPVPVLLWTTPSVVVISTPAISTIIHLEPIALPEDTMLEMVAPSVVGVVADEALKT